TAPPAATPANPSSRSADAANPPERGPTRAPGGGALPAPLGRARVPPPTPPPAEGAPRALSYRRGPAAPRLGPAPAPRLGAAGRPRPPFPPRRPVARPLVVADPGRGWL